MSEPVEPPDRPDDRPPKKRDDPPPDDRGQYADEPRRRPRDDRDGDDRRRPRDDRDDDDYRRRRRDDYDDRDYRRRRDDDSYGGLIPYKNPKGLLAYYFGVFSLIPCLGLALGPMALIFGFMGVSYANKNPSAKGMGHAITGIVLGAIASLANWGAIALGAGAWIFGK
jgi:hypothetical protein